MKKIFLLTLMSLISINAYAQHRHHRHYHNHAPNWVAPVIIGGIVGYALANNQAQAAPPAVYYSNPHNTFACPLGFSPVFTRTWTHDRWGRSILVDNFVGCQ
jgi:hypothetical protein